LLLYVVFKHDVFFESRSGTIVYLALVGAALVIWLAQVRNRQ
jgi:hypothetical protein